MELAHRLEEALKQTKIVIEQTDRGDIIEVLSEGLEYLERGVELLENDNDG